MLDGLLRHAQPHLRLVMAARWDPLLPLHRLALDGSLVNLRAGDLAFTLDDVVALMDRCGHLSRLSHRDVQLLHERTEGWVAGLRLAAASMEGEPDIHGFVRDLAGEDHSLAGYLMSEVLARQPEDRRRFMLDTSIVDELTEGLAADLTERDDAAAVLADLERTNSFVSAVGSRRQSVQVPPLVRRAPAVRGEAVDARACAGAATPRSTVVPRPRRSLRSHAAGDGVARLVAGGRRADEARVPP